MPRLSSEPSTKPKITSSRRHPPDRPPLADPHDRQAHDIHRRPLGPSPDAAGSGSFRNIAAKQDSATLPPISSGRSSGCYREKGSLLRPESPSRSVAEGHPGRGVEAECRSAKTRENATGRGNSAFPGRTLYIHESRITMRRQSPACDRRPNVLPSISCYRASATPAPTGDPSVSVRSAWQAANAVRPFVVPSPASA